MLHLVNQPDEVERIYRDLRRLHPGFPEYGSTLVLWRLLYLAGLPCPFEPIPERMAGQLLQMGFRPMPRELKPRAGDFFLAGDDEGIVTQVGLVAKVPVPFAGATPDWFMAADHLMGDRLRPYRRRTVGDPSQPDTRAWLRCGTCG